MLVNTGPDRFRSRANCIAGSEKNSGAINACRPTRLANHGRNWHACEDQGRCGGRYCDRTRIDAETAKVLDCTGDDGSGYEEEQWGHPKMIDGEVPDEDQDQCLGQDRAAPSQHQCEPDDNRPDEEGAVIREIWRQQLGDVDDLRKTDAFW